MVVVLNSYEAIYNAFVRHSEAFADRNELFVEKVINPDLRGQSAGVPANTLAW